MLLRERKTLRSRSSEPRSHLKTVPGFLHSSGQRNLGNAGFLHCGTSQSLYKASVHCEVPRGRHAWVSYLFLTTEPLVGRTSPGMVFCCLRFRKSLDQIVLYFALGKTRLSENHTLFFGHLQICLCWTSLNLHRGTLYGIHCINLL